MIRPVGSHGQIETGGVFTPISRPRVLQRIEAAAAQRIVLLIAPAGYGKSFALREYLDNLPGPQVRYDVHSENGRLLGFVRGFADALAELAPDARKTVSGAYEKCRRSKTPGTDLAMWLHAHIKTFNGVIAIDDLHVAEMDPHICEFLVSLIERTKGRTRWIIASRSTLDLPVGSWLAYGETDIAVDEQDLRFTMEEARETAIASRVHIRDDQLDEILRLTDGWPTALSFALRTSTRSVDLRNIAATTRDMTYRYLAEQVYRGLGAADREFLHFAAYLPEIDLNVIRLGGYSHAKAIVESIRDKVAFIYPDRPGVYRCHDLFRDFLQHELELQGDSVVGEMRRRAACALEAAGRLPEALRAYTEAQSATDIVRLLESCGFDLIEQAHGDVVHAALEALTSEARASNAVVLALRGATEADAGRFDRADSLLERAALLSQGTALSASILLRLALLRLNQGTDVVGTLNPLTVQSAPTETRAEAASLLAVAHAYAGRTAEATAAIEMAEHLARLLEDDDERARILHRIGIASLSLGAPYENVAGLLTKANTLCTAVALYALSGRTLGAMATAALLYLDDMTKAVWYAQQATVAAVKSGDRLNLQNCVLQMINIEAKRGNDARLEALFSQFESASTTDAARTSFGNQSRALQQAWKGHPAQAHQLLANAAQHAPYAFDRMFNESMLALYYIADGKRDLALKSVARALSLEKDFPARFLHGSRLVEIAKLLCAVVEALAGRITAATRLLQAKTEVSSDAISAMREVALCICRVSKMPQLSADVLQPLDQLREQNYGGVAKVIAAAAERCFAAEGPADAHRLTKTEVDVLVGLASGQSPKDIALGSGRSVYTVQAHIQNSIRKLGCSGRNEALTVARRRGILA